MDFFNSVISFLELALEFLLNFVNSIIQIFQLATTAVSLPPLLQGFLPSVLGSCVFAVVACGVIKFIFGR